MGMALRARRAAVVFLVGAAGAASCALPPYEVDKTGGTGGSGSGISATGAPASAVSSGDTTITSSASGMGDGGDDLPPDCVDLARKGEACGEGTDCVFTKIDGECTFEAHCNSGQWKVEKWGSYCPLLQPQTGDGCDCSGKVCEYEHCGNSGIFRQWTCDPILLQWTSSEKPGACCGNTTCMSGEVCVTYVAPSAPSGVSKCESNPCPGEVMLTCECAAPSLCNAMNCATCEPSATEGHLTCHDCGL